MSITHAELLHELRHVKLGRRLLGYNRKAVKMLLEQLSTSYEELAGELETVETLRRELNDVTSERDELRLRVSELDVGSATTRELAALVQETLASAQRAAEDLRAAGKREAEELRSNALRGAGRAVDAARAESRKIAQRDRLHEECRTVSAGLRGLEEELAHIPPLGPTTG